MRDINKIILHCSATREGQDISTETIRGWHVNERGWSDIGYHFVVLLDGTVDKARPVERQGAHVRGHNKGSMPSFDPMNQYIGDYTPLDGIFHEKTNNGLSDNPIDTNWGGVQYSRDIVDNTDKYAGDTI